MEIELFDGKKANVVEMKGGADNYYWDATATIKIDDNIYKITDAGSYSGWIPTYQEMSLEKELKLSGIEKIPFENINDIGYFVNFIREIYELFVKSGAKESYVYAETQYGFTSEIRIDGKLIQEED